VSPFSAPGFIHEVLVSAHENARSLALVTFAPFGLVLAGLLLTELACTTESVPTPSKCFSTMECAVGEECSGGSCIQFDRCTTDAQCGGGNHCTQGVCRSGCTSNDQCASGGLECHLGTFQCMPKPNPIPMAGSGGGGPLPGGSGGTPSGGSSGGVPAGGSGGAPVGGSAGQPQGGSAAAQVGGSAGQPQGGTAGASGGQGGASGAGSSSGGFSGAPATGTCGTTWQNFPSYMNNNGSVTLYDFSMGSNCPSNTPEPGVNNKCVNCSFRVNGSGPDRVEHVYTGEGRYFAAMNTEDFRSAAACGACVEVTRDGGRRVVATVVDQCPIASNNKCRRGHVDLSREAFRQIANESEGYVGSGNPGGPGGAVGSISWRYVACPVPASQNVTVRLKEQNNQFYTAVRVQDHAFPITSVQIKGANATRDGASNHWLVGSGNQAPGPWPVRVTDVNGWMYDAVVNTNSGDVSTGRRATCN